MKKFTLLFLIASSFLWSQTVRVDVSELTDVASVDLLANFGGNFAFFPATDAGNGLWEFDLSTSVDAENEYLWRVTYNNMSTEQENLTPKVGGQGVDNDVAVGQAFNTDFVNFCNRVVTIGDPADPPTFYFNSFRQPGVTYTELTLTAPAPGAGENYYMFYSVNGFSEFGGPGTVDNGDGTYTALVRPDVAFEYKWVLNDNPGTVGADNIEDILSCTNDGVTINTDNSTFSNRLHAAGEDKMDEFGVCPDTGGGGGTSSQSQFCDTEVFHLDIPAEVASAIDLTIENTGPNTMKLTGKASDITFLTVIGTPIAGGAATASDLDLSVPGEASIVLTWGTPPTGDVVFQFIQWRKTSTGGATWQINDATTPFAGVCEVIADEDNVTLSDLQVDGSTVAGFSPSTVSYDVVVNSGDPIPVVSATAAFGTVGTITQASALPGIATFDVTSQNTNFMQTYTVNFVFEGPQTAAPTPPLRDAMDVKSIFSDAYMPVTTFGYGAGANTYNTDWCPANTELVVVDGNNTNKTSGLGCEGIDFQGGRFDASDFDTLHIDLFTENATQDASFNIIISQWSGGGGQDYPLEFSTTNASTPALPANAEGQWISLDIPLDSFINTSGGSTVRDDIVQMVLVSNLDTVWYDNIYFYKETAPANDNCATATVINPTEFGQTISGTNVGATNSGIANACQEGVDVWYSFTAVQDGEVNMTIDPGFAYGFYSDCSGTLVGGCDSSIANATTGTTYYIRIGDMDTARRMPGGFNFSIAGSALSNDSFDLLSSLKIYPNPTNNNWNIEGANVTIDTVEVFDMLGKRVQALNPNSQQTTIDASSLKTGIYLAKLYSGDAVRIIKLVKN